VYTLYFILTPLTESNISIIYKTDDYIGDSKNLIVQLENFIINRGLFSS